MSTDNPIRKAHATTIKVLRGQSHQPVVTVASRSNYWYATCPACGEQVRPYPSWVRTTRKRAKDALHVHRKLRCQPGLTETVAT